MFDEETGSSNRLFYINLATKDPRPGTVSILNRPGWCQMRGGRRSHSGAMVTDDNEADGAIPGEAGGIRPRPWVRLPIYQYPLFIIPVPFEHGLICVDRPFQRLIRQGPFFSVMVGQAQ